MTTGFASAGFILKGGVPDYCDRLLVVRLSSMGDVAIAVHAVEALRRAYPRMEITVLTRPRFIPLFRDIPRIGFFPLDLQGRHRGVRGLVRLWSDLKELGIDSVADLHDVLRTKILRTLLRMSGCRVSVIDKGRADKALLVRPENKLLVQLTPTLARYCQTLLELGLQVRPPVVRTCRPRPLDGVPGSLMPEKRGLWIGVAPFAGHRGKAYPEPLAEQLVEGLALHSQRVVIFGGGEPEREFARRMERRGDNIVSAVGVCDLGGELDLISNLDAIVTMDSAVMHMASLVGTRAVSLWGATHPYAGFYGFGQREEDIVQADMPCRPCSGYGERACRYGDYRCLTAISPQQVIDRVMAPLRRAAQTGEKRAAVRSRKRAEKVPG